MVDWEQRYKEGDTPWDKEAPHPGLVAYLRERSVAGSVLVPGCGAGHDVRALAAGGAAVTGLDIAPSALNLARSFPKAGAEVYEQADLFALPEHLRGLFDWVWEHTCFCAIDPDARPAYVAAVATALKPGGHLLAVFYLDPGDRDGGPPFGVTVQELDELFSPAFSLEKGWVPAETYTGRENRELMRVMKRSQGPAGGADPVG